MGITLDDMITIMCGFAKGCDDEKLFISIVATMFRARADEFEYDLDDYVKSFYDFIQFSVNMEKDRPDIIETLTKLIDSMEDK